MKNLICLIFGHKEITDGWYPNSKVIRICCMRCDEVLEEKDNPTYTPNWIQPIPPWEK